ncbi:MAG TPA: PQQ-binding-like beta-propeller repeat protein [Blastocatellia bacterium]|nr:PQQ-binding-like beta-propeller repeat protein [Blastocatellia bacterium]
MGFRSHAGSARGAGWIGFSIMLLLVQVKFVRASSDWVQFRGPNGSGVSATSGLPAEFGPDRSVIWKIPLPAGHSSPVLTDDRIFVTAFESSKLLTICVDRKTGRILWRREAPRTRNDRLQKPNNPASPSPVTDGRNVFVFFQDFGMLSYTSDGKERWRLPLGPFNMFYGFGASPILVNDEVVLPCDQDTGSYLLAIDKNTGKVRWKVDRPGVISGYSTPIVFRPGSGPAQIIIPESFQLSAYSADNGDRLWWVRGLACEMKSIPSYDADTLYINGWGFPQNQPGQQLPTIPFADALAKFDSNRDGKLSQSELESDRMMKNAFEAFDLDRDAKLDAKEWDIYRAMMAAENGLLAIRLGGKGDMTQASIRWKYQRPVPQVPSTVLYQGVLYMVNDSGILLSFDPATGKVLKQGRLKGGVDKYFASPVAADGKVYLIGQGGAVSVVKAAGEWEILAVNQLDDEVYATPAIADGRIYIRTQSALYCFGSPAK